MAQFRQSGHHYSNGGVESDHVSIGVRTSGVGRARRSGRSDKSRGVGGFPIGGVIVVLCLVLVLTLLTYYFVSAADGRGAGRTDPEGEEGGMNNDLDFLTNVTRTKSVKVLGFGQGSGGHGRDSRYWDKDDRRRDEDYNEDDVEHASKDGKRESSDNGHNTAKVKNGKDKGPQDDTLKGVDRRGVGLYNENGRNELKMYEAEYEASLKNGEKSRKEDGSTNRLLDDEDAGEHSEVVDTDNDYDDGIDSHDPRADENDHLEVDKGGEHFVVRKSHNDDGGDSDILDSESTDQSSARKRGEASVGARDKGSLVKSRMLDTMDNLQHISASGSQSTSKSRSDSKRKGKRRKFSGSCEMKLLNSTTRLVEPFESRKFARFSLQYVEMEDKPVGQENWEPRFAGHQSLQEREDSFMVHDKQITCGFVKGPEGSPSTGFDLSEDDENYISRCHIAVISCIFGNSDRLRSPATKMVTRLSRKNVCFVMFVDEVTLQMLSAEGQMPDREGFIGLWKIVVVKNLPYTDMRRVGKIPKLLPHRLFPSARYSMWLDSKLRLQVDPLLILEYILWRKGYEYAISNHYDRHCVWEEVAQNKRLNKYNHTIIDQQFNFYQADGLKRFDASDPNKLLPSNVPEGSLIVRAHTPMSNLFSCLWFNEVDRFTPRDQLSFAFTYQKLRRMNPDKPFYLNMFKDCERRAIAKLFRHRSDEKRNILRQQATG